MQCYASKKFGITFFREKKDLNQLYLMIKDHQCRMYFLNEGNIKLDYQRTPWLPFGFDSAFIFDLVDLSFNTNVSRSNEIYKRDSKLEEGV